MVERSAVNYTAEHHKPLFWRRLATKLSPLVVPQLYPTAWSVRNDKYRSITGLDSPCMAACSRSSHVMLFRVSDELTNSAPERFLPSPRRYEFLRRADKRAKLQIMGC
jgi:hypothetical protein